MSYILVLFWIFSLTAAPSPPTTHCLFVAQVTPPNAAHITFDPPLTTEVLYASADAQAVVHASFTYTQPFDALHSLALPVEPGIMLDVTSAAPVNVYRCSFDQPLRLDTFIPIATP